MKKFLAVFLSVIMASSLCVAGFAAGLRAKVLPGQMIIVAQDEHIKAGGEYTVPVSIVSDVSIDGVTSGDFYTGFKCGISGLSGQYVDIEGVEFTSALQALAGFEGFECRYDDNECAIYCAFKVSDLSILKQTNLEIANIKIKVSDKYKAASEIAEGDATAKYNQASATLDVSQYDLSWISTSVAFDADEAAAVVSNGNTTYLTKGETTSQIIFNAGQLADAFPWDVVVLTWKEKLTIWAKKQALYICNFFSAIFGLLAGFLEDSSK
jgi:hypothetical protein